MEAYRVRKRFGWRGWIYAPNEGPCQCGHEGAQGCNAFSQCTGVVASSCSCKDSVCRCDCGILRERYAGDIWLVEEGHPRKAAMLASRFATYDASILPIDDLLKEKKIARTLEQFDERKLIASRSR